MADGEQGRPGGPKRVLVVEDDRQVRNFIVYALEGEGFACEAAGLAREAVEKLRASPTDLILLDLGLPDYDGMEVIEKVRGWSDIPIIVISARDQDAEKVQALDGGADDYLTKPFSASELLARIRVALRHAGKAGRVGGGAGVGRAALRSSMSVGGLHIDIESRLVTLDGRPIHLTPMEFDLMSLLFRNIGKVLTTGAILRAVWGVGYGSDTQALRTLMAGLRRKVEQNPATPRYILTEVGVGYRLASE